MAQSVQPVSQKTAFLAFVAMIIGGAPMLYVMFSRQFFVVMPAWDRVFYIGGAIAALVALLVSIPFFIRGTADRDPKERRAQRIFGPICVAGLVFCFFIFTIPMVSSFIGRGPVSVDLTVSDVHPAKRCAQSVSFEELNQGFCVDGTRLYNVRPGTRVHAQGKGNSVAMFVEDFSTN